MSDHSKASDGFSVGDILALANDKLSSVEARIKTTATEEYANILVLGAPRSGTTLLTQTIFQHMDVACTNNLMARFWKAPNVGAAFSREILGDIKGSDLRSQFGTTMMPWEPHEFSRFWHNVLNYSVGDGNSFVPEQGEVDWSYVRSSLFNINASFGKAVVHKPLELVGYCLEAFAREVEKAVFVYVERDDIDAAVSIADARIRRGEGLDCWWSCFPPQQDFQKLIGQPFNIQIAGQVRFLKRMYRERLDKLDEGRVVSVTYNDLCQNPVAVLEQIRGKTANMGREVAITGKPNAQSPSKRAADPELIRDLEHGFQQLKVQFDV